MSKKYYKILEISASKLLNNRGVYKLELQKLYTDKEGRTGSVLKGIPKDRKSDDFRRLKLNERNEEIGTLDDSLDVSYMSEIYEKYYKTKEHEQKDPFQNGKFAQKEVFPSDKRANDFYFDDNDSSCHRLYKTASEHCLGFTLAVIDLDFGSIKKQERDALYEKGFDFKFCNRSYHYVRYKRSAASARVGKCLFILEDLYGEMFKWGSCGLRTDDQVKEMSKSLLTSWEAYVSLTLSGIEETRISIPANSILFLKDAKSTYIDNEDKCFSPFNKNGVPVIRVDDSNNTDSISFPNTIWDGEALMDESVFDDYAEYQDKHMMLLRSRFFKSCAFKTRLQGWFFDFFKAKGEISSKDELKTLNAKHLNMINGFTTAEHVGDIKLVVTESSLKYLKFADKASSFGDNCSKWLEQVKDKKDDGIEFGVVKTDHASYDPEIKDDRPIVKTNYQMLNTLGFKTSSDEDDDLSSMLLGEIKEVKECKDLPQKFIQYVEKNKRSRLNENNAKTEEEIAVEKSEEVENDAAGGDDIEDAHEEGDSGDNANERSADESEDITYNKQNFIKLLVRKNKNKCMQFLYYRDYVQSEMNSRTDKIRSGRLSIDGCYATLFGNPIELLLATVLPYDEDEWTDDAFSEYRNELKYGNDRDEELINTYDEVYSPCYEEGEVICGVRSPHITMGNLFLGINRYKKDADTAYNKYLCLSPEIICINSIGSPVLQQLNGADFDSDSMLITNDETVVNAVKRQYKVFKIPCNSIKEVTSKSYKKNKKKKISALTQIDTDISNNRIGQIVNLSAYINELYWQEYPVTSDKYEPKKLNIKNKMEWYQIYDLICRLAILSNLEIDKAKRKYRGSISKQYEMCSDEKDRIRIDKDKIQYTMSDYPPAYKKLIKVGKKLHCIEKVENIKSKDDNVKIRAVFTMFFVYMLYRIDKKIYRIKKDTGEKMIERFEEYKNLKNYVFYDVGLRCTKIIDGLDVLKDEDMLYVEHKNEITLYREYKNKLNEYERKLSTTVKKCSFKKEYDAFLEFIESEINYIDLLNEWNELLNKFNDELKENESLPMPDEVCFVLPKNFSIKVPSFYFGNAFLISKNGTVYDRAKKILWKIKNEYYYKRKRYDFYTFMSEDEFTQGLVATYKETYNDIIYEKNRDEKYIIVKASENGDTQEDISIRVLISEENKKLSTKNEILYTDILIDTSDELIEKWKNAGGTSIKYEKDDDFNKEFYAICDIYKKDSNECLFNSDKGRLNFKPSKPKLQHSLLETIPEFMDKNKKEYSMDRLSREVASISDMLSFAVKSINDKEYTTKKRMASIGGFLRIL